MALPIAVYSAKQVRALDQRAIESLPISGYLLMKRAGEAAGLEVSVIAAAPVAELKGDARQAHADFAASGGVARPLSTALLREGEVIVDAVLGTGLTQTV